MKLLLDENLSHRLVAELSEIFPGSVHVREVGLASASDDDVWQYAARNGLAIVSKDADFHQRSFVEGFPPKVIWIRRGNCTTAEIGDLLRRRSSEITEFGDDDEAAFLAIS